MRQMKAKKKEKLSLKKATRQLSDLIGKQLKTIPPKERRKKTEQAYKKLLARIHKKPPSDELSKASELAPESPARLVARSSS